ncbi:hypothetical protein ACFVZD_35800 [Streptomyces sp. NPDC058287]|uniref:hypothetical protein n=1 Tax=unclassified Streptomyces TaxID=2593676 RepID=UPI0036E2FB49
MSEYGGTSGTPSQIPRSRLADYAETDEAPSVPTPVNSGNSLQNREISQTLVGPDDAGVEVGVLPLAKDHPEVIARRREFARLLGEFRRTAVLVPLGDFPGPEEERGLLTADFNGIRFILAFSDEQALARYAQARGEFSREWTYRTILGARLLDVAVPAAGAPCGVALDCADGPDGMVFPPVRGIVPDEAAVDRDEGERGSS